MKPLRNPEQEWAHHAPTISRPEVESRIGPTDAALTVLSGGLANVNVRIGADRVLRIHRREPASTAVERALLSRPWTTFSVPSLRGAGPDFLVLDFLSLEPVPDDATHGAVVGRALAEIHGTPVTSAGFLDPDLAVREPVTDVLGMLRDYACAELRRFDPSGSVAVVARLLTELDRSDQLVVAAKDVVLLHADFKPANLHVVPDGRLCVLDWEFAYAGPALMDVGQLHRYGPSAEFSAAFARSYREAGRCLPADFERMARRFDLFNLAGLLGGSEPGTRRASDVQTLIQATLDET